METIDIERIKREIESLPEWDEQISLQGFGDGDYITPTIGWKRKEINEEDCIHFNFDLPYTNKIIKDLGMYRTRLMRMHPRSIYSYHWDKTPRLHIPLITNTHCIFMFDKVLKEISEPYHEQDIASTPKNIFHLPADGNMYFLDTTMMHSAINFSPFERVHIVGCLQTPPAGALQPQQDPLVP